MAGEAKAAPDGAPSMADTLRGVLRDFTFSHDEPPHETLTYVQATALVELADGVCRIADVLEGAGLTALDDHGWSVGEHAHAAIEAVRVAAQEVRP